MKQTIEIDQQLIQKNATKPKSILVVEDDKINIFLLERILKPLNFDVHVAENGLEAVNLFKEKKFDLILMDIYMPIMDGLEASKNIRLISSEPPIIAVTAATLNLKTVKQEYGIDHVVKKPIEVFQLKNIMNTLL